ncbi:MAG: cysteine desulfurase [Planctomycetota bacterium]|nr:MAG: cysteine desulfurase [Planctomycetota bacterium]
MTGKSTDRIYLDNNATTRPFDEVIETVARVLRDAFGNPGSRHADGRVARRVLEDARESIAQRLGADPDEVVFTSGGTEASNMAILGLTAGQPRAIALTRGEHPATMEACRFRQSHGWELIYLEVDSEGRLIADQYDALPWDRLGLVTVILAHNETGVIQDVAPLAERCARHGVPLHLDAVQAVGKIPVDFGRLGATTLAFGAHKFHGPRGIGGLLLRKGVRLAPLLFGGHQEQGRRPGTEPVALAAGMAEALRICTDDLPGRMERLRRLRDALEHGLEQSCGPTHVNGSREHRLPNTSNISFVGLEGEPLLIALDLAGISCSLGSTCASGAAEPAPSLVAMGCPPEVYRSAVRFSVSTLNTEADIERAVPRIAEVVRELRRRSAAVLG